MQRSYDLVQDSFPNKNDFPVWLPFLLAFIGTLGCIYTAYIAVPKTLQRSLFSPDVSALASTDNDKIEEQILPTIDVDLLVQADKEESVPAAAESYDCPPLFTLSFKENSLKPILKGSHEKMSLLRDWLTLHPSETIILGGHSSSEGLREPNLILSYRRATSVQRFFVKSGISKDQLSMQAFGEDKPIRGIPASSGENRRVSMQVKGMRECQNHSTNE
jgi:hypothetical protein